MEHALSCYLLAAGTHADVRNLGLREGGPGDQKRAEFAAAEKQCIADDRTRHEI